MSFEDAVQKYEDQMKRLKILAMCAEDKAERSRLERKSAGLQKLIFVLRSFDENIERRTGHE